MKKLILGLTALLSVSAFAHTIEGTLVLEGSIKTKLKVNGIKSTCKVDVDKVKNLMLEDTYGNPAYNVLVEVSLSGSDFESGIVVKYNRESWFNNLFKVTEGKTEVRDLEYQSTEGSKMVIDNQGRIKSVTFQYQARNLTCLF